MEYACIFRAASSALRVHAYMQKKPLVGIDSLKSLFGAGLHPRCLDGLPSGYILHGAIRSSE